MEVELSNLRESELRVTPWNAVSGAIVMISLSSSWGLQVLGVIATA